MPNVRRAIPFRQSGSGPHGTYVNLPKDSMQTACQPITVRSTPPNDIPLMNGSRVFFDDIDAQAASLSGWSQHYVQLSAGAFRGGVQRFDLGGIKLFIEDLQQTVHQTGMVRPDVVALGLPLYFSGSSRFCGKPGSAAELYVFSGANGYEFHSPQRHMMLGIEIDRPVFEALFSAGGLAPAPAFSLQAGLSPVNQQAANELRALGVALLNSRTHESSSLETIAQSDHVRDALLEKLLTVLDEPMRTTKRRCGDPACKPLEARALELIMTRLDQPPSVAELCNYLGVSRRTLQNCVQSTWGMGPLAWVNTMRLNAVRSRLKTAISVTEAATEFGFWHFGHFSTAYHTLFGEPPSSTLGRHRRHLKKPRA
jgi:AraC family ethanolamine operon transcriptional activator